MAPDLRRAVCRFSRLFSSSLCLIHGLLYLISAGLKGHLCREGHTPVSPVWHDKLIPYHTTPHFPIRLIRKRSDWPRLRTASVLLLDLRIHTGRRSVTVTPPCGTSWDSERASGFLDRLRFRSGLSDGEGYGEDNLIEYIYLYTIE